MRYTGGVEDPQEFDAIYMPGFQNRAIRYYFYLNAGLAIVNNFRNLILAILGFYFVLKLDMPWLLPIMFVFSTVLLTIVGYIVVHRVNRVSEWLGTRFGTHYGLKSFNYQQRAVELLKEINDKMKT